MPDLTNTNEDASRVMYKYKEKCISTAQKKLFVHHRGCQSTAYK
jgi:hypothetical protein